MKALAEGFEGVGVFSSNFPQAMRVKWRWTGVLVVLISLAFLLSVAKADQSATTQETKSTDQVAAEKPILRVQVLDKKTQKPLAGVNVEWRISCQPLGSQPTDADGKTDITLPAGPLNYLSIKAGKAGFVPIRVSWNKEELQKSFPKNYTFSLTPGTSIGGVIRNEKGEPIEGATVFILVPTSCSEKECIAISDYPVRTDAQGKWRCDILPAELDDIWLRLAHPDYVSDVSYGATPKPSMESLRDMTGVMVMKKGFTITGRVVDKAGKPIANAQVSQGSDRWGTHFPDTRTNAEGEFEFKNVGPDMRQNKLVLTVQAAGYAPDLKEINVDKDTKPVEFVLEPARTIKGRIVDPDGKPVVGAFMSADTWRGHRSIEWRVNTDSEGRFSWKDAPADEVLFSMGKEGFMSIRRKALTPSDDEYILTLPLPLTIKGSVTDSKTGQPIDEFKVIQGIEWDSKQKHWEYRNAKIFRNGIYEVKENEPYPGHLVRIEAPGYKSADSRVFKDNEVNVTFDFKLEKDTWRKITILSPDGQPAVGAEIAVCTPSQQTMVQNGKFQRMQTPNILTTDAKGKFSLPSQTEPYKLIIVHDTGCANVSEDKIKSTSEIKLDAWGSVEGTIFMGAKPADGQIVNLMETSSSMPDGKTPRCHFYYTTNTDPKGHFVFNRVFSGQWNAARGVRYGNSVSFTNNERVEVKSGETSQVKIGGTGRPVIGKIVLPEDADFQADWTYGHYGISTKQKQPAIFEKVMKMSMEERKKWYETWKDSEEAKALQKSQKKNWRSYSFRVNPDGTFRAEDIPAGTYTLNISLYEPPKGGGCGYGQQIGTVNHDFTIPQMPNGRSDEPLDLGMIELNIPKHLKTGTTAPDFEVKTLDGKTIKLSDLKGKYVLLDFWATWCGPCVAEMPHLKEIHKKFGSDEHFVMISLSLDNSPDDLKSFVEKNELKWLQGYLGKWADTKVPANYGVNSIPSIFLIDPDGKIIEKQLRGQAIETAVEKVLQQSNR